MDARTGAESAEAEKAGTSTLPIKKRQFHLAIDAKQLEGYDSSDSVEIVANSNRAVIDLFDSDEETVIQTAVDVVCECLAESGYLADGEAEDLLQRCYNSVVKQEPRRKRRAEGKSDNHAKA